MHIGAVPASIGGVGKQVYPFEPSRSTLPSQSTTVAFSAIPGHAALSASFRASDSPCARAVDEASTSATLRLATITPNFRFVLLLIELPLLWITDEFLVSRCPKLSRLHLQSAYASQSASQNSDTGWADRSKESDVVVNPLLPV
jgi:hypothetical protein